MGDDDNSTNAFLLDYLNNSFPRTTTEVHVNFYEQKEALSSSRSLGFGIPDTFGTRKVAHYCFGTLLALIGLAGTLGNVLVLYVFTRYRRLRGGGGPLILSLASGDLMVSVWHFMPAYSSFAEIWSFGDGGCQVYAAFVGLGGLASLVTLSVIAADRFSVIMGKPLPWLSGKKTCIFIWFFCLILTIPPFFGWSRYIREGLETSCSWDYTTRTWNNRSYYIFLLFFGFVVPVGTIIFSYVGILCVVCQHSNTMNGVTRNGIIHNKRRPTKNDLRTAQVILTIIVCFLMSWIPYSVVSMVGQFGDVSSLSPLGTALPAIFAKASVIYNPIVYGLSHPHFRSAIRMLRARHFPKGRYNGPLDRYHYHQAGTGTTRKRNGIEGKVRFTQDFQQSSNNRQGGHFGETTESGNGSSNRDRGISMRMYSSRGSGTEVIINRKGWIVLRGASLGLDSEAMTVRSYIAGNDELSGLNSTIHSEPDLVSDDMSVKLPEYINITEYFSKNDFIRKSIFRSENCLENLLKSDNTESATVDQKSHTLNNMTKKTLPQDDISNRDARSGGNETSNSITRSEETSDTNRIPMDERLLEHKDKPPGDGVIKEVSPVAKSFANNQMKHSSSIENFVTSSCRSPIINSCNRSYRFVKSGGHHAYARNDVVQLKRAKCVQKVRRTKAQKSHDDSLDCSSFVCDAVKPYISSEKLEYQTHELNATFKEVENDCSCTCCSSCTNSSGILKSNAELFRSTERLGNGITNKYSESSFHIYKNPYPYNEASYSSIVDSDTFYSCG